MTGGEQGAGVIAYPEAGAWRKLRFIVKYHLHVLLYTYFWLGLFVCGLVAPDDRISELGSTLISEGWHLSLMSALLVLPVPVVYALRMGLWRRRQTRQ